MYIILYYIYIYVYSALQSLAAHQFWSHANPVQGTKRRLWLVAFVSQTTAELRGLRSGLDRRSFMRRTAMVWCSGKLRCVWDVCESSCVRWGAFGMKCVWDVCVCVCAWHVWDEVCVKGMWEQLCKIRWEPWVEEEAWKNEIMPVICSIMVLSCFGEFHGRCHEKMR